MIVVKAVVEEHLARACLGCGEKARGAGGGVVRRGGAGTPFFRVGGGAGQLNGEGNRAADGGAPLWAIWFGGKGKRRG
jgi:hypothetical protein